MSLTFKLPIEAILYLLLHSLSTVSVVENSCGRVSGFRRRGREEAKKSKNSLWELTLRLKRGGSSPPKYFFHIFVTIFEHLPVGRQTFLGGGSWLIRKCLPLQKPHLPRPTMGGKGSSHGLIRPGLWVSGALWKGAGWWWWGRISLSLSLSPISYYTPPLPSPTNRHAMPTFNKGLGLDLKLICCLPTSTAKTS